MKKFTEDVKYFFVSDLHIGHENIIKTFKQLRPFNTIQEHDNSIIENWKNTVSDNDVVFLLGDVFWKLHPKKVDEICASLPGEIFFIRGNHDRSKIVNIMLRHFEKIENCEMIQIHNQFLVLSHYPIEDWQGKNKNTIHIHGHSHFNHKPMANRFCVSLENIDYKPIELSEIQKRLKK